MTSRDASGRGRRHGRSLAEVRARKRELAQRCLEQRLMVAEYVGALSPSFASVDRVAGVGRSILSHRLLLLAGAMLLVAIRPRAALALAARLWGLRSGVRALRRLAAPVG